MEAGNRCFDQRVPEEINRRIVDHISDINLPYSSISREYLLREGIPPDRVIKTGSPMYEVLNYFLPKIRRSEVLGRFKLTPQEYFVVSCHREENVDEPGKLQQLIVLLNWLAEECRLRVVVSVHPRTRKRLSEVNAALRPEVDLRAPLSFTDYVQLEINAKATLSDSGTISEESSILRFPALNIREAHERPEAMEEAAVMMTGFDVKRIGESLRILADQAKAGLRVTQDYQMPNVSAKVVRIIQSYTDYINRVVWHKS
jgi:UDP-N-acetylglucosamine 2-epimerase (non-hydrolysing)